MIKHQKTKTIACKENNRSSDAVSGNFILGCRDKDNLPYCQYCYVDRFNRKFVYINTNRDEILNECDKWVQTKPLVKVPNQVHPSFYLVDIGCDVDINAYWNQYDWIKIFDWFKAHPRLGATFATKWYNSKLLEYDSQKKIRIRHSLMPEYLINKLERSTSPLLKRITGAQKLYEANWEIHLNLSPVVYYDNWLRDYKELFHMINNEVSEDFKQQCGLEVIFLTHHAGLNNLNIQRGWDETLLWNPSIQEKKISKYGGENVRYEHNLKYQLVQQLTDLINSELKIKIRYIF